jgi:hypothetical protein
LPECDQIFFWRLVSSASKLFRDGIDAGQIKNPSGGLRSRLVAPIF